MATTTATFDIARNPDDTITAIIMFEPSSSDLTTVACESILSDKFANPTILFSEGGCIKLVAGLTLEFIRSNLWEMMMEDASSFPLNITKNEPDAFQIQVEFPMACDQLAEHLEGKSMLPGPSQTLDSDLVIQ